MPFTPAHAVVALAFVRSPLVPGAVAVGAMSPDFPLYFTLGIRYADTHALPGMIAIGLPLALLLFALWRVVIRPGVPGLLPRWLGERCPPEWSTGWRGGWRSIGSAGRSRAQSPWVGFVLVLVSLLIGLASHVVWDLFTHRGRWGGEVFPVIEDRWGPLYAATWLHLASTILGLAVILAWGVSWLKRRTPVPLLRPAPSWLRLALWWLIPGSLLAAAVADVINHGMPAAGGLVEFAFRAGTTGAAAILVAVTVAAGVANLITTERKL